MKKIIIWLVIILIIAAGLWWLLARNQGEEPLIGGETDEHGCLIAAGYSWCEPKQKCLRIWEEPCVEEEIQPDLPADNLPEPEITP
jgi:hypothetical protein